MEEPENNPMNHPAEQPSGSDDSPKFGRLLLVLAAAVLIMFLVSVLSAQYFA
jgi:hypothetical protein